MFNRVSTYNYVPSYIFKTGSKYSQLTEEYQGIFKRYIKDKNSLNDKEYELLFLGIKHIAEYIYYGFFYSVKENYDSKTNQEKVISAIYYRLSKFYGSEDLVKSKFKEQLFDLAESSLFYSMGMEKFKKRSSFFWKEEESFHKNIIKHSSEVVFKSLVFDFMKEQAQIMDSASSSNEDLSHNPHSNSSAIPSVLSGEEMIEKSGLEKFMPKEIKIKIIEYLDEGEDKYLKDIQSYLEKIYSSLRKKNISLGD